MQSPECTAKMKTDDTDISKEAENGTSRILCVGIVVVDVVTHVKTFPVEDSKSRCDSITEVIGGNAFTNCKILSMLGKRSSIMACIGTGTQHHLGLVNSSLDKYHIARRSCVLRPDPMPQTICLLNESTGSRTCIHYRGSLPVLDYEMFVLALPSLHEYSWIHFEGRYESSGESFKQIEYLYKKRADDSYRYAISVEIEKAHPSLVPLLLAPADVIFVSKDFCKFMGFADMKSAAAGLLQYRENNSVLEDVVIVCPWGSYGAAACQTNSNFKVLTSDASPPIQILNTLGAGDTFLAACISKLSNHFTFTTNAANQINSYQKSTNRNETLPGHRNELTNPTADFPVDMESCVSTPHQSLNLKRGESCPLLEPRVVIVEDILQETLEFGCRVAGLKCGLKDIGDLENYIKDL